MAAAPALSLAQAPAPPGPAPSTSPPLLGSSGRPIRVPAPGEPVTVPPITYIAGDVIEPLPAGSPLPSADPRNFEGIWATLGRPVNVDGGPPPYRPEVMAEVARVMKAEEAGMPVVRKNALCRPNGSFTIGGNQFPTQILQRADKMLVIAEEGRTIWSVYIGGQHPQPLKPTYGGDSVAHWEGDTLVVDSVGHKAKGGGGGPGTSEQLHVVTRITRAVAGNDPLNGTRLVIYRTIDDPATYTKPWTSMGVARWRPDLQMMDFNCEESSEEEINMGLTTVK